MKKVIWSGMVILMGMLFLSCQTVPPATPKDKEKTLNCEYDMAFAAVKRTFMDLNVKITGGSKESGFLTGRENLDTAVLTAVMLGKARTVYRYYDVSLIEKENSVLVLIKIHSEYEDGTHPTKANKPDYTKFWEKVQSYL
jgi:hypothetical protein